MTRPSDTLREEHTVIEHLLGVLDGMAGHLAAGEPVPAKDLDAALEIAVNFADKCHHAKEERALFPLLEKFSPDEGKLLAHRLHGDHEAFRHLMRQMRDAVPKVGARDAAATTMFAKNTRTYSSLLREHIATETRLLFPLMDRVIPANEMGRLEEEFDRIEKQEVGAGVHERYEHTVHSLAERYGH